MNTKNLQTVSAADCATASNAGSKQAEKKKLSFKEQKEFEALDAEIPQLEAEKAELEELMSSGKNTNLAETTKKYKELLKALEEKYARWEELAERT